MPYQNPENTTIDRSTLKRFEGLLPVQMTDWKFIEAYVKVL